MLDAKIFKKFLKPKENSRTERTVRRTVRSHYMVNLHNKPRMMKVKKAGYGNLKG